MIRLLRAFAWMRWRLLVNGVRGGERRDRLERISRVIALVVPAAMLATAITSVVVSAGAATVAGWVFVTHRVQASAVLSVIRFVLLVVTGLAVFVPLILALQGQPAHEARLRLLPIPARLLHFLAVATSLTDPWMVFIVPGLVGYGAGMIAGGLAHPGLRSAAVDGLVALAAAGGLVIVLASLSALAAFFVSWIVRDRRRSEAFVVIFVLVLTALSLVPALTSRRAERELAVASRQERRQLTVPRVDVRLPAWTRMLPSELYGRVVGGAGSAAAWFPLGALYAEGLVLYGLSSVLFRALLDSAGEGSTRRRRVAAAGPAWQVPGLLPGTSAVAIAQARTALRSVRGRLVMLLPAAFVGIFVALVLRDIRSGLIEMGIAGHGHLVLGLGILFALYAAQPIMVNQFGSDRAGLTLEFLVPLRDVDLVRGKALGCAAIMGPAVLLNLAVAVTLDSGGSPWLWLATLVGGAAAFLLLSPVGAWLSVLLPVSADLSKTGRGGNPHTFAMLVGMVAVAVAGVPPAVIVLTISVPRTAFAVMVLWTLAAWAIAHSLLGLVARMLAARRENLALVAQGR